MQTEHLLELQNNGTPIEQLSVESGIGIEAIYKRIQRLKKEEEQQQTDNIEPVIHTDTSVTTSFPTGTALVLLLVVVAIVVAIAWPWISQKIQELMQPENKRQTLQPLDPNDIPLAADELMVDSQMQQPATPSHNSKIPRMDFLN